MAVAGAGGSLHGGSCCSQSLPDSRQLPGPACPGVGPVDMPLCQRRVQRPAGGSEHGRGPGDGVRYKSPGVDVFGLAGQLVSPFDAAALLRLRFPPDGRTVINCRPGTGRDRAQHALAERRRRRVQKR